MNHRLNLSCLAIPLVASTLLTLGCVPSVRVGLPPNTAPAVLTTESRNRVAVASVDGLDASLPRISRIILLPLLALRRGQRIEVQPGEREILARVNFEGIDHQSCVGTGTVKALLEPRKLYRVGGGAQGQLYLLWVEDVTSGMRTTAEATVHCEGPQPTRRDPAGAILGGLLQKL